MSFEKILEAARKQDLTQLQEAMGQVSIDVWKPGSYFFSAASQLASEENLEKNIPAINFLFNHGANINYVASGAAMGGHRAYAEELLARGANTNDVAIGAALGGHIAYAEELLARGAYISEVARGAALGGHRAYAKELLARGANISYVARGAAGGRHVLTRNAESQISYLSFFSPSVIPELIRAFRCLDDPIIIDGNTEKRIIAITEDMERGKLSYAAALTRTAPASAGMLYLLMKLTMRNERAAWFQGMPFDVWEKIFSFVTPVLLNREELKALGFTVGRTYFASQLSIYQSSEDLGNKHKARAKNFREAVIRTNDKTELTQLTDEQAQVLEGKNPYPKAKQDKMYKQNVQDATVDKFYTIIGFWKKELTGIDAQFQENKPEQSNCMVQ